MLLIYILSAYLIGAIPSGLILARLIAGVDVRHIGSGNIGATNALRAGGKAVGILTLLADIFKGATPVFIGIHILHLEDGALAWIASSAFLGHIFPVYLKFQGGKGVATLFGVLLPWQPWIALGSFIIWLMTLGISRYVSAASIIAALAFPLLGWLLQVSFFCQLTLVFLAIVVSLRHWGNVSRIIDGTEPKIGIN